MPGPYSIVLSCLAIDILLSAGASGKDAGQRDAREVVKTPQSAGSASDRIGADVPEEYYRWFSRSSPFTKDFNVCLRII